ncbi:MAG: hypothetical protein R3F04_01120 [Lysobacteraceae bacterium]
MVESTRLSNGKKKGSGSTRCGNPLPELGMDRSGEFRDPRFDPEIRRWFDPKASKKPHPVAIKSVAHKLARAGYHLIKDGGHFDVKRSFRISTAPEVGHGVGS